MLINEIFALLRKRVPRLAVRLVAGTALTAVSAAAAHAAAFTVTNLVTDDQTANPAQVTDGNLVNAWGISYAPTGPFWVSDNGTGKSTLYTVNPTTDATAVTPLVVAIPGDGSVTGQAFNGSSAFNGDRFMFVSEDGTISGWRGALGTTAETLQLGSSSNVYKGATLITNGGNAYLLAANFRAGTIDVIKGAVAAPNLPASFVDPGIPAGYAPFNVQVLGSKVYVTYALQDGTKHDEVAGPGNGFVSVFDENGNFLGRVASNGPLDAPWGLAIAPSAFDTLAGDLLVGNFGNGAIDAFDTAGHFVGALTDTSGNPLAIDGLWGLIAGNGAAAGSTGKLYFSAGPTDESHGLFGVIADVPEPASLAILAFGLVALGLIRQPIAKSEARKTPG